MSHSTTAATRQYEMKLNITLPTMITGAAFIAARAAPPDGEDLLSDSDIGGECKLQCLCHVPAQAATACKGGRCDTRRVICGSVHHALCTIRIESPMQFA